MSAIAPAAFSGFVIARLRPELVDWLCAAYLSDPNASFGSLRQLTSIWRTAPPTGAAAGDVQTQCDQLHGELANIPSPSAVAPQLIRRTIIRERQIPAPYQPLRSLIAYFRFDVRGLVSPTSVNSFVDLLSQCTALFDWVQREPGLAPPSPRVQWEDDVDPNGGIDASWQLHTEGEIDDGARTVKGINCNSPQVWDSEFDGNGVGFVDIELGWFLDHPDLPAPTIPAPPPRTPFYNSSDPTSEYHGTSVLGVVVGSDNTQGIVGIAPAATLIGVASYVKTGAGQSDPADITNAILTSLANMAVGDVLLLEVQTTGGGSFPGANVNLPVEVVDLWFDAIRLAVGSGMVVIEPAGNGHIVGAGIEGWDLDTISSVGSARSLNRDVWGSDEIHLLDSGAIMVSGCYADLRSDGALDRVRQCNFGSRVDCFAWGEEVYTTSVGAAPYGVFGETSAASAVIAGAAILVQQMYRKTFGSSASSAQIRSLLSTYGTNIYGEAGVQPDLGLIAAELGSAPDVFVRDHVGDDGAVPGAFTSQSPDIVVRSAPLPNPQASLGEGSRTEDILPPSDDVVPGAANYVYVRMRNRNAADATDVVARVYWAEAGTLIVPTDWNFIGESAPIVVPGAPIGSTFGSLTVTDAITWTPMSGAIPPQMPEGHGCFIALLSCAADPPPPSIVANAGPGGSPTRWSDFLDFIGRNNNAAWRNFTLLGVETSAAALFAKAGKFVVRAAPRAQSFEFEVLQQLPKGVRVRLTFDAKLAQLVGTSRHKRRRAAATARDRTIKLECGDKFAVSGVRLPAKSRYNCSVRIAINRDVRPQPIAWALRQLYRGKEVGRVTFAVDVKSWKRALRD